MDRSLGEKVPNNNHIFIFVDYFSLVPALDDPAENTVSHITYLFLPVLS